MTFVGTAALELHLDKVLRFLQPHVSFVNCHMVGYLTDNLWTTFIPDAIQQEVKTLEDVNAAIRGFWNVHNNPHYKNSKFDGLINFIHTSQEHQSNGIAITTEQLDTHLQTLNFKIDTPSGLQIKEFMSEKKHHEVEVAAQVISTLCGTQNTDEHSKHCVIDAGDGKGYLSSRLAFEHRLMVLGIDANAGNTFGAQKRTAQLEVFIQNK